MIDLIKYITVFGIAVSPWGEELVAIPVGIIFKLNPGIILFISVIGNIIPVLVIAYMHSIANRHPAIRDWLGKIKTERGAEFLNKYGAPGLIVIAPLIGVYSATLITIMMGMDKRQVILAQIISVIIYGLGALALTMLGIKLFSH